MMKRPIMLVGLVTAALGTSAAALMFWSRQTGPRVTTAGAASRATQEPKEFLDYCDRVEQILGPLAETFLALAQRAQMVGEDGALANDPTWMAETDVLIAKLSRAVPALKVELPVYPPGCEGYHENVKSIAESIEFIAANFSVALKNRDGALLIRCAKKVDFITATVPQLSGLREGCTPRVIMTEGRSPQGHGTPTVSLPAVRATAGRDIAPFVATMPDGWRDLRFGMSENAVRRSLDKDKTRRADRSWDRDDWSDTIPTLSGEGRFGETNAGPGAKLRRVDVSNVDAAFEKLSMWFLKGKLAALMVTARDDVSYSDLVEQATTTYGIAPRYVSLVFGAGMLPGAFHDRDHDDDVAFWRSQDGTVMIWGFNEILRIEHCVYIFSNRANDEALRFGAEAKAAGAEAARRKLQDQRSAITF